MTTYQYVSSGGGSFSDLAVPRAFISLTLALKMWWSLTQSLGFSWNFLYSASLSRTMANSVSLSSLMRGTLAIWKPSFVLQGRGIRFFADILCWSLFGVPSWARTGMPISRESSTARLKNIVRFMALLLWCRFYTLRLAMSMESSQPLARFPRIATARIFPLTLRPAFANLSCFQKYLFCRPSGTNLRSHGPNPEN